MGPDLISGAIGRVGHVEAARRAHRIGECEQGAVAEAHTPVVEGTGPGLTQHQLGLRRAAHRRGGASRVAAGVGVQEALLVGPSRANTPVGC